MLYVPLLPLSPKTLEGGRPRARREGVQTSLPMSSVLVASRQQVAVWISLLLLAYLPPRVVSDGQPAAASFHQPTRAPPISSCTTNPGMGVALVVPVPRGDQRRRRSGDPCEQSKKNVVRHTLTVGGINDGVRVM